MAVVLEQLRSFKFGPTAAHIYLWTILRTYSTVEVLSYDLNLKTDSH